MSIADMSFIQRMGYIVQTYSGSLLKGAGVTMAIAIICTAFPGNEGVIREKRDLALATAPVAGVSYGGYITRPSVLQAVLHAMELRHLSPITFNQMELTDEGLVGTGTVAPTIPLISRAGIEIVLDEDGVKVRKVFSGNDFDFPSPFEINSNDKLSEDSIVPNAFKID